MLADPSGMAHPSPLPCDEPLLGPGNADLPGLPNPDEVGSAVALTLAEYFVGINTGDYRSAFDQLSPRLQGTSDYLAFAEGVSTSYDFDFELRDADIRPDSASVWLEFVSLQDPDYGPEGESCTLWSLDYELVRAADGRFLIDAVRGHAGSAGHQPCP
jgi:hypothetical protein